MNDPERDPWPGAEDDGDRCLSCGAPEDEDCADDCECTSCNNRREAQYLARVTGW